MKYSPKDRFMGFIRRNPNLSIFICIVAVLPLTALVHQAFGGDPYGMAWTEESWSYRETLALVFFLSCVVVVFWIIRKLRKG